MIQKDEINLSITLKQVKSNTKCRFFKRRNDCPNTDKNGSLITGSDYIAISGWSAGGPVTFALCIEHAQEFFKQVDSVKKEIKKLKKDE